LFSTGYRRNVDKNPANIHSRPLPPASKLRGAELAGRAATSQHAHVRKPQHGTAGRGASFDRPKAHISILTRSGFASAERDISGRPISGKSRAARPQNHVWRTTGSSPVRAPQFTNSPPHALSRRATRS